MGEMVDMEDMLTWPPSCYRPRRSPKCRCCGQADLHWEMLDGKWRLFSRSGSIHKCKVRPLGTNKYDALGKSHWKVGDNMGSGPDDPNGFKIGEIVYVHLSGDDYGVAFFDTSGEKRGVIRLKLNK